jgi:hypothetical protein
MGVADIANRNNSRWVNTSRWSLAAALSLGLAVLLLGPVGIAHAQAANDDDETETIDTKLMKDFLRGMGLRDGTEKGIDYHERSPLVIPPSRDLPTPGTTASIKDPAWPNDKEMPNSPKAKKKKKVVVNAFGDTLGDPDPGNRPLRPEEMDIRAKTRDVNGPDRANPVLSPSELGVKSGIFGWNMFNQGPETAKFGGEPPRTSLLDPPTGYRTPAADQPYQADTRDQIKTRTMEDRFEEMIGAK